MGAVVRVRDKVGMPVFYNVRDSFGGHGMVLVSIAVFSALTTSVIGFFYGAGRVIATMSSAELLPRCFSEKNAAGVPVKAIILVMLLSIPMPFLGCLKYIGLTGTGFAPPIINGECERTSKSGNKIVI